MPIKPYIRKQPGLTHLLGRVIGTRWRGVKGVDRLLRTLHNPDRRLDSWMETVANALPDGPKYNLSTRWFVEWTTWFYGTQDHLIHHWIRRHARPDWIAFDIGMNFGFFACVLAQKCSSVHGFEPVPWLAERARANVELNGFRNVSIVESALSEKPGEALLNLPSEADCNWGTSSLVHKSSGKATLKVPLDTIDDYISRHSITRLDFIKIDVEGAENLVFKGALKTIKQLRPIIIFERNDESLENIVTLFRSHEYEFFNLKEEPLSADMKRWPIDILVMPNGK
jgi:FkbM family methyltransferase